MDIRQTVLDLTPKKQELVLNTQDQILDFFTIARCPSKEMYLKVRDGIKNGTYRPLIDPDQIIRKAMALNLSVDDETLDSRTEDLTDQIIQESLDVIDKLYENRQRIKVRNTIWAMFGAFIVFCMGYRFGVKAGLVGSLFDVAEGDNIDIIENEKTRIIVVSKE